MRDSYGKDGTNSIVSASGKPYSVMVEALHAGLATGIVNSGHLAEPGTGAMLASVDSRADSVGIVRQIVESGCHVILGGGEIYFLPRGVSGRHGHDGVRDDNLDLVARASASF
jgi:glycerophosphoryl diester phosphodiesterase